MRTGGAAAFPGPRSDAVAKAAPNLLLITIDTLRADRVSSYGGRLDTPTIDRLAAKGIIFRRAFAQATTTLPTHTNMLLGVDPLRHGVHDNSASRSGKSS
jgi:arylsulfatase A-like enzyme